MKQNIDKKTMMLTKQQYYQQTQSQMSTRNKNIISHYLHTVHIQQTKQIGNKYSFTCHIEQGYYYKLDKSFYYKQKILLLYMIDYCWLVRDKVQNGIEGLQKQNKRCQSFLQGLGQMIEENLQLREKCFSNDNDICINQKIDDKKCTNINKNNDIKGFIQCFKNGDYFKYKQIFTLQKVLDLLLQKWFSKMEGLIKWMQNLLDRVIKIQQQIYGSGEIIQLKINNDSSNPVNKMNKEFQIERKQINKKNTKSQTHFLYKKVIVTFGDHKILEIIQTNSQQNIFFKINTNNNYLNKTYLQSEHKKQNQRHSIKIPKPQTNQTKKTNLSSIYSTRSKLNQILQQTKGKKLIQSEDDQQQQRQDNGSDRSMIVKDDEYFRLTGLISGGRSMCDGCQDQKEKGQQFYSNMDEKNDHSSSNRNIQSITLNSISPKQLLTKLIAHQSIANCKNNLLKPHTQMLSQMYTRSSSMQKVTASMSTSIDLLFKKQLIKNKQKQRKNSQYDTVGKVGYHHKL